MKKTVRKSRSFLWPGVVLSVIIIIFAARVFYVADSPPQELSEQPAEPVQMRSVVLYFEDPRGGRLLAEEREIPGCNDESDCIRGTVQALLDGPEEGGNPIFPKRVTLKGVYESDGVAVVDFSRELLTDHPGGSMPELMTLYGLVNTVVENFPFVRGVRIVVEGGEVETLKGHVDLREVVNPDFAFSPSKRVEKEGSRDPKIDLKNLETMER